MSDVLAYVEWVWSLLEREEERLDTSIDWQRDMSYDEMAACAGVSDWRLPDVGEVASSELATAQLYWPALRPL